MKLLKIIKILVYVFYSAIFFIQRDYIVTNIRYLAGSMLLLHFIFDVLEAFFDNKEEPFYHKHSFYFGIAEGLVGLLIMVYYSKYDYACIMLGVWGILKESLDVREDIFKFKKHSLGIVDLTTSAIVIVMSAFLILEPTEKHVLLHTYLIPIELLIDVLLPPIDNIINQAKKNRKNNRSEKN